MRKNMAIQCDLSPIFSSILRWLLHAINDEKLDRPLRGLQFEAKLFLNRRKMDGPEGSEGPGGETAGRRDSKSLITTAMGSFSSPTITTSLFDGDLPISSQWLPSM